MPLEATLIIIDNSEWCRNADFTPNRFEAQTDAANMICGAKTNQHPESSVGLLTMAGDRVEVLVTPTQDLGKMLAGLHGIQLSGEADFLRGIQTAQLALKHRQNKNQKQRIICFVGSPVTAEEKKLETLGKQLKKNNVSIDLISFGQVEENSEKLNKLLNAANSGDTSHILEVPGGSGRLLSDAVLSSPICIPETVEGEGGGGGGGGATGTGGGGGGGGGGMNEFGVDPNADPELYMALRMSLEESQREAREREGTGGGAEGGAAPPAAEGGAPAEAPAGTAQTPAASAPTAGTSGGGDGQPTRAEIMAMTDVDDELRQALLMSLDDNETSEAPAGGAPAQGQPQGGGDSSGLTAMLEGLPGVDVNDPRIQQALQGMPGQGQGGDQQGGEKKDEDKKPDGGDGGGKA
uniref:VWFA domain-containing protein n=1 Tax=Chromera velia CCMP2878 TaxID=1169474 RepID=A0A0G4GPM0_9ALVE|eukprot:Cvel_22805.t1-p1 / transcript=Cvel_22805.t1 / gene=Cvel_22805 / organism=Chromera_velia_CCMP2878 / gene_product=26S proteasome non-ATPase regulatory subunit 4, putative / transcript_product=26S proteasome non-ATPase regulatory subunit 4, putative / location=Cvel_scaffold2282:19125-24382(-) / protein_length=406 / sequence_SO=supercontig / SO=protein_coding / is_pseudo=false